MDWYVFAERGVAVGAVLFVVCKFLTAQRRERREFTDVICNHMDHEREAHEREKDALVGLARLIERMFGKMEGKD